MIETEYEISSMYAASQDKKLYVIAMDCFELIKQHRNIHRMMFDIVGIYNGNLYTISHPCSEIFEWNDAGDKVAAIPVRLRLSGSSIIEGNTMYIASRSINGIEKISLDYGGY